MTIDKSRPPRTAPLPAFTPVPRQCNRHDGWTAERQHGFIQALADTGSVKAAARRVNMTPEGAYLLRRHPDAASFRKAWEAALALGVQQLEDIALERALHGQEVPVYSYGKLIGSRIVHNDRLLMFMLRNRAPTRFAADGRVTQRQSTIGHPGATELSRLKREWRKQWEKEAATTAAEQTRHKGDDLLERFHTMHRRWFLALGPRARQAYRQFREIELAEKPRGNQAYWAGIDLANAREDLSTARDDDERDDAREAIAEAEAALAQATRDREEAEADYAQWFRSDRRAKIWLGIDVMFGKAADPAPAPALTPAQPKKERKTP